VFKYLSPELVSKMQCPLVVLALVVARLKELVRALCPEEGPDQLPDDQAIDLEPGEQ